MVQVIICACMITCHAKNFFVADMFALYGYVCSAVWRAFCVQLCTLNTTAVTYVALTHTRYQVLLIIVLRV